MSRPLRIEFPGAYYHVINRGLSRLAIFKTEEDRHSFLDLLGEVHNRWGLKIQTYCLMNNHYHLCVQTPHGGLSRIMRHVDGVYTQRFNRKYKRDGPLFRGRYKAIVVEKDLYLLEVARYIHQNPIHAGLVTPSEDYVWSSLRYYRKDISKPSWLDRDTLLGFFNGKRERLLAYMEAEPDQEMEDCYGLKRTAPVRGSERFKNWIRVKGYARAKGREIPEARYLAVKLEDCVKAVAAIYGVNENVIRAGRRGSLNEPRQMAMYACREIGGHAHGQIAEAMGLESYSTVSSVCATMKKLMIENRYLKKRLHQIRGHLSTNYRH